MAAGWTTVAHDASLEAASGTGTYEWHAAEDRLVWSPGLLRIYGVAKPPDDEESFSRLVHPEDRVRVQAETAAYLGSAADVYGHRFRILRPDGSIRLVLDRGVIERDDQGLVRVIRGMNVDLTDIGRGPDLAGDVDEAAAHQYAELAALYAEAPLGLALLDRDLRFVRINSVLAEMNGYTVEEHLGRRAWDLVPDLRGSAEPALRQVIETGLPLRDLAIRGETRARPGVVRDWREQFFPLRGRDGKVQGIGVVCEEITDRVATERALPESEARLAAALHAGKLGVHEFDPRTGAIVWDAAVRRIWGIGPDDRVEYETFLAGLYPDDAAATESAVAAALDPEGPGFYEAVYRVVNRQTGEIRWVRADGDVTFEGGVAVRMVGTVRDITEEKRRESELRESEARFRTMADSAPVMVWMTDADGTCTYLNSVWYEFTGQTVDEAVGFGWLGAVHPDDAEASERVFREATAQRRAFRLDYRLRRADGVYRWAIDSARPRLGANGEFHGFIGSVIDITERKEAEQKLRAAHDTFRHLVERSPFGINTVDADFRLAQTSEGARNVFASVQPPLAGKDFAEVLRVVWPEPFASEAIDRFRHTLATGEPYRSPRTVQRRADIDATGAYDWRLERIVMPDGRPGVVCHFYDLSERQAYEEKIRYLLGEMNHRAKNILALVDAIAKQTASAGSEDFVERFGERVRALAASHDLLLQTDWELAELSALIRGQLQHFGDLLGGRILLEGPQVDLAPDAVQTLGMALHELATNAAKYGALSNGAGRVDVAWRVEDEAGVPQFSISWTEKGGPPVRKPSRSGFGGRVVKTMVEGAFSGTVALDFAETGVAWSLRCPLSAIAPRGGTPPRPTKDG